MRLSVIVDARRIIRLRIATAGQADPGYNRSLITFQLITWDSRPHGRGNGVGRGEGGGGTGVM